jgi:hypothetical protein
MDKVCCPHVFGNQVRYLKGRQSHPLHQSHPRRATMKVAPTGGVGPRTIRRVAPTEDLVQKDVIVRIVYDLVLYRASAADRAAPVAGWKPLRGRTCSRAANIVSTFLREEL